MLCLTVYAWAVRAWHLGFPYKILFDEHYYVNAAAQYLQRTADANSVHPPLAKILMACFMELYWGLWRAAHGGDIAGFTDYGTAWRFGSLVLGTAMVPLLYYLAFLLFRSRFICGAASFLLATDFLHFVQSRIAMLDMYLAFFVLVGSVFAWRHLQSRGSDRTALVSCLAAFALGAACKWNALSTLFGFLVLFVFSALDEGALERLGRLQRLRLYVQRALAYGGVAVAVVVPLYLATFIPFFTLGGECTFARMLQNHRTMIEFRYKPEFTHRYISQFYSWPLVLRPTWYHLLNARKPQGPTPAVDEEAAREEIMEGLTPGCRTFGVVAMGSPFFWWTFLLFLGRMAVKTVSTRDRACLFVLAGYLAQWLLWAGATRGGFLFYMLPCVPFMALIAAWALQEWLDSPGGRLLAGAYFFCVLAVFVIYYPFLSCHPAKVPLYHQLFPFEGWR